MLCLEKLHWNDISQMRLAPEFGWRALSEEMQSRSTFTVMTSSRSTVLSSGLRAFSMTISGDGSIFQQTAVQKEINCFKSACDEGCWGSI